MNVFKCDQCGCECHINPPVEPIYEKSGSTKDHESPVMVDVDTYNHSTGQMETRKHHKTRDLKNRCYIVRLSLGMQNAQKDLCEKCYLHHFDKLNETFRYIATIGAKEGRTH